MGSTFDYITGKYKKPTPTAQPAQQPTQVAQQEAAPAQPQQTAQPAQQQQQWHAPLEPAQDTQPTQKEVAPSQPTQATPPTQTAQPPEAPKPRTTYTDIIRKLFPEMDEKKRAEEDEKIKRKKKRDSTISAIGDALTAMANIAATTRYASPADVTTNNMSKKVKERYDKIKADRDKNHEAYRQMIARAQQLDAQQYENDVERDRKAREKADDDVWKKLSFWAGLNQKREANENLNNYRMAGLNQRSEQFKQRMENDWKKAVLAANTRRYAADHKSSGGGSNSMKYKLFNPITGETEYFPNKGSWVSRYVELHPDEEPDEIKYESTKTDPKGKVSTTTSVRTRGVTDEQIGRGQRRDKEEYQKKQQAKAAAAKKAAANKQKQNETNAALGKGNNFGI